MPIAYDPAIIETFVARLYSQADSIVATHAVAGVLIGGAFFGLCVAIAPARGGPDPSFVMAIAGLAWLAVVLVAVARGRARAFHLRLQAQQVLCQLQIERNTRTT